MGTSINTIAPKPLVHPLTYCFKQNQQMVILPSFLELLESHPDYPSLAAVVSSFEQFGINCRALRQEKIEKQHLDQSLFVQLIGKGLVFVEEYTDEFVTYIDGEGQTVRQEEADFDFDWSGVVLLVDFSTDQIQGNVSSSPNWGSSKFLLGGLLMGGLLVLGLWTAWQATLITISASLGGFLSWEAFRTSYWQDYTSKFCLAKASLDCGGVFKSRQAILSDALDLRLSDLSIAFFTTIVIYLLSHLLFGVDPAPLQTFILLGLVVIPYSIFVQAFVLKQWCSICLGIVGCLLVMSISTAFWQERVQWSSFDLSMPVVGATSLFIWMLLKRGLIQLHEDRQQQLRYRRIAMQPLAFEAIQSKEPAYELPVFLDEMEQNTKDLVVVFSLSCPHCKDLLSELVKVGDNWRQKDFPLITYLISDPQNKSAEAEQLFTALNQYERGEEQLNLLKKWLSGSHNFRLGPEIVLNSYYCEQIDAWLSGLGMEALPLIIYKGRKLHLNYTIEDALLHASI